VRAATEGQLTGVREGLAAAVAQGSLRPGDATAFARALARREALQASGEAGEARLRELRRCAPEIDSALRERAGTHDDLGALAALVLIEEDDASARRYGRFAHAPPAVGEAPWRGLGARTLTSGGDAALRRALIVDPDQEVRRGALHAALVAADPDDVDAVLEAARLDPYPLARREAVLAAGAIGGERAAIALRDLWPRATGDVRDAIVQAWATDAAYETGGRHELERLVDEERGATALAAALALVKREGDRASAAEGALQRAIEHGSTEERVLAIDAAPERASLAEAFAAAEKDPDEAVAAAAMKRRLAATRDPGARDALVARLLPMATGAGAGAPLAREALARAHVHEITPALEQDGASTDPPTRIRAGATLAMLGELGRAAVVAADPEPRVRTTVACEILRAAAGR
jgi:hypothetical protein